MKKTIMFAIAAAAALGGAQPAAAQPAVDTEREVRVPLFELGRFRTFQARGRETLYVRSTGRRWYRITTMGPCPGLPWARAIGVDTRGSRTLDRHSTLIVEGDRCLVRSVTRSDGPPPRRAERRRR